MEQFKSNPMVSKQNLLSWSGVPRSSFYYKRGDCIRGRKPSKMNITQDGELVDNSVVLQDVESILQQEFCCYGYKNVLDKAERGLEHLCMDINIHIHGAQRNALLLTVIDAFSLKVLTHMLRFNIKKGDVIVLLSFYSWSIKSKESY